MRQEYSTAAPRWRQPGQSGERAGSESWAGLTKRNGVREVAFAIMVALAAPVLTVVVEGEHPRAGSRRRGEAGCKARRYTS